MINFGNKVNIMILGYTSKLGLKIYRINVRTQKFDDSTFKIFEIVLAYF